MTKKKRAEFDRQFVNCNSLPPYFAICRN